MRDTRWPPPLSTPLVRDRRERLLAWLNDPQSDQLPDLAKYGFDHRNGFWTAGDIVRLAGIYEPDERSKCLTDLKALARTGHVWSWGNRTGGPNRRWTRAFEKVRV